MHFHVFVWLVTVLGGPRNLRVSDPTTSSLKLSWEKAPGKVLNYLVTYTPATGGEPKEVTLRGNVSSTVLKELDAGTTYSLSVNALYRSGAGSTLDGEGTTLDGKLYFTIVFFKIINIIFRNVIISSCTILSQYSKLGNTQ